MTILSSSYFLDMLGITRWQRRRVEMLIVTETSDLAEHQPAGLLFNAILQAIGLTRQQVVIMSSVQQLPTQIQLLQPKILVVLGITAAQKIYNTALSLQEFRESSQPHIDYTVPVKVSFDPVDLLTNPKDKAQAYVDWLAIQECL